MRYMMFIKHAEGYQKESVPPSMFAAMDAFVGAAIKDGTFIDGAGLKPSKDGGKRVRLEKGKISVIDGPFAESKELVGGYAIIEAKTEAEALKIAKEFMEIHRKHWPEFEGESEMRPFEDPPA